MSWRRRSAVALVPFVFLLPLIIHFEGWLVLTLAVIGFSLLITSAWCLLIEDDGERYLLTGRLGPFIAYQRSVKRQQLVTKLGAGRGVDGNLPPVIMHVMKLDGSHFFSDLERIAFGNNRLFTHMSRLYDFYAPPPRDEGEEFPA